MKQEQELIALEHYQIFINLQEEFYNNVGSSKK